MIIPRTYQNQHIGVFGLARSGLAAISALKAAGATIVGFDDRLEVRSAYPDLVADYQTYDLSLLDALVISPGVPLTHPQPHPIVKKAKYLGIPILGDFDLFLAARENLPAHRVVGITGTNGKSTTTSLLAHMCRSAGLESIAFGNIGISFLGVEPLAVSKENQTKPDQTNPDCNKNRTGVYVAELSSFQLDLSPNPFVDVAILLNITPDHLDRHGSMQNYAGAKACLFENSKKDQINIICTDDPYSLQIAQKATGPVLPISVIKPCSGGLYLDGQDLIDDRDHRAAKVGSLEDMPHLKGQHNHQNALAAFGAALSLGISASEAFKGLVSFQGLQHRQEVLGLVKGAAIINDSKATNWDSAVRALDTFSAIRWIAGGRLKGNFAPVSISQVADVRCVYLYGEAADKIADALPRDTTVRRFSRFEGAVMEALQDCGPQETVLLAPAATAFDQFSSFEERGDRFKALVNAFEISLKAVPEKKVCP